MERPTVGEVHSVFGTDTSRGGSVSSTGPRPFLSRQPYLGGVERDQLLNEPFTSHSVTGETRYRNLQFYVGVFRLDVVWLGRVSTPSPRRSVCRLGPAPL